MTRTWYRPEEGAAIGAAGKSLAGGMPALGAALATGGPALAAGAEGAIVARSIVSWTAYELVVGGKAQGTWVVKGPYDSGSDWTFVPPGDPWPFAGSRPVGRPSSPQRALALRLGLLAGVLLAGGGIAGASVLVMFGGVALLVASLFLVWRWHPFG